jgi:flagellar motility protein MotE (MotC chaperone)
MIRILQSSWVAALVGSLLYLATTAALLRPEQLAAARESTEAKAPVNGPSWNFRNPELDQSIEELRRERQNLTAREQQLHELETRLEAERQEIRLVTHTIDQLQADFDKSVIRFKGQELENTKRQTKIVSGMSPDGAAIMLQEMPQDQMVRILFTLKPDITAPILDALSKMGPTQAKRAAEAAERMRQVLPSE